MKKLVLILFASMFLLNISAQESRRYSRTNNNIYKTDRSQRVNKAKFEREDVKHNYNNQSYTKQNNRKSDYVVHKSTPAEYHKKYNHKGKKHYKEHNYGQHYSNPVVCRERTRCLPCNHTRISYKGGNIFFSAGLFYEWHHDYYQQIVPPVGIVIYEIPHNCRRIVIGGKLYYEFANTLYDRIETRRGLAFVVAGELRWN